MTTEDPYAPTETQCRARTRRKTEEFPEGVPCKGPPIFGRKRCRMHGGRAGRPPIHGKKSGAHKHLNEVLEQARTDEKLWDVRRSLAVLDVHMERASQRATEKDTPYFRQRARGLMLEAREASGQGDQVTARAKIEELARWLDSGVAADAALDRLAKCAERFGSAQSDAWRLRLSAQQAINANDLLAILGKFTNIVREEVDAKTFARINTRIQTEVLGAREVGQKCITTGGRDGG